MLKYKISKLCRKIPDECLQFWGAQGYLDNAWISRIYRDMRHLAIGGGADEIMLRVLSKKFHQK